jgi:hypothetical protein
MQNEFQLPKYPPVLFVRVTEYIRRKLIKFYRKLTHPNAAMVEFIQNLWLLGAISVATELGIADILKDGPKTIGELANLTGTLEDPLYRLMRMLASHGIFKGSKNRSFSLTPIAKSMQEGELKYFIQHSLNEMQFRIFGSMIYTAKTGRNSLELFIKNEVFDHLGQSEELNDLFNNAMTNTSKMQIAAIMPCFDFNKYKYIIDVGGGHGFFLSTILAKYNAIKGTVFDLPHVVNKSRQLFKDMGVSDRADFAAGSFFETIPGGGDLYLLKNIIHNWSDGEAVKILQNIRKAMPQNGRLLIIEAVIENDNRNSFGKMIDVYMMVGISGRERTKDEYQTLLENAGFKIENVKRTVSPLGIIVAAPLREKVADL